MAKLNSSKLLKLAASKKTTKAKTETKEVITRVRATARIARKK